MSKHYQQVVTFNHEVLGIEPRTLGVMSDDEIDHLGKAIIEELNELHAAHDDSDIVGCVDALIDLLYFAKGGLYKLGVTDDKFSRIFTAVHEANMSKRLGIVEKRGNGVVPDAIKPKGWVPPEDRIRDILIDCEAQH